MTLGPMAPGSEPTSELPRSSWIESFRLAFEYRQHTIELLRGLSARHKRAALQATGVGPRLVSLFGPEANRFVMLDVERQLSAKRAWDFIMGRIFANGLLLRDGADHLQHRRTMQSAFHQSALRTYVDRMNAPVAQVVDRWEDEPDDFRAFPAFKALTLELACSIFLGVDLGTDTAHLNRAFEDTVAASMSFVRLRIPGLEFDRGMRGREFMMDLFGAMVPSRRQGDGEDMFSRLCRAESDCGESFSEGEIVDYMIFLMMAAHDTTTSSLSSLLYELGRAVDWQERVREEVAPERFAAPGFDDLMGLDLADRVVKETLRLHPPLSTIPRMVERECVFEGFRIPKDAMVAAYPLHSHYLDDWWSDPWAFDPDRFAPGRAEHERHPYLFVPFGGGAHMCIGHRFAELQIKAILCALLRRYRWRLPEGYRLPEQQAPIAKPTDGLPVRLERIA
ncbi:MAG: cytochrome P450 [Alphaproteobacteria bacterium]